MSHLVMGKKTLTGGSANAGSAKKARASEVPSVAAMGSMSKGGSKRLEIADDNVHVGLYQYMQNGSLYSSTFSQGPVWVAQMATTRMPSPLFQIMKLIKRYGESQSESEDPPPCSMEEVASRYRAQLQFVSKTTPDPDEVGWARNRMGFYIDEAMVKEFFMYFDDLMAFRRGLNDADFDKIDKPIKILIHMLDVDSAAQLNFDKDQDQLECEFVVLKEVAAFMSIFDLFPPTFPSRLVTVSFEMLTDTKVNIIFGGNTRPFQTGFVQRNIGLCSLKKEEKDTYAEYFRVLKNVDASATLTCTETLEELLDTCLQGAPVVVRIKETTIDTTIVEAIILSLQKATRHMRVDE